MASAFVPKALTTTVNTAVASLGSVATAAATAVGLVDPPTPAPAVRDEQLPVHRPLDPSASPNTQAASLANPEIDPTGLHLTMIVIGKVTDSTARILVEVLEGGQVTVQLKCVQRNVRQKHRLPDGTSDQCDPTKSHLAPNNPGVDGKVFTVRQKLDPAKPKIFKFEGLDPDSRYEVSLKNLAHLQPASQFRTLLKDWKIDENTPAMRFAAISCNLLSETLALRPDQVDLWADLALRAQRDELDYCLHIGDQIYADEFRSDEKIAAPVSVYATQAHAAEGEGLDKLKKSDQLVFRKAMAYMEKIPRDQWEEHRARIEEFYRQLYRETWTHRGTAVLLANVPNMMIFDDHDFVDNWGQLPHGRDKDRTTVDFFIATCARQVYWEYQGSLSREIDLTRVAEEEVDHHFHVFGEYGVVFTESRGAGSFRYSPDDPTPFLGRRQWADLDAALGEGGMFDKVRHLLIICPTPVVYLPHGLNAMAEPMVEDALGHWASAPFRAEQTRMLNLALAWQEGVGFGDQLKELQAPPHPAQDAIDASKDETLKIYRANFPSIAGAAANLPAATSEDLKDGGVSPNMTGSHANMRGSNISAQQRAPSDGDRKEADTSDRKENATSSSSTDADGTKPSTLKRRSSSSLLVGATPLASPCCSNRRVTFVGGDVHVGGHTRLFKHGHLVMEQLVSSAVANHVLPAVAFKIGELIQNTYTQLQDGWSFEHQGFTRLRNVGLIDTVRPEPNSKAQGPKPAVVTSILSAD